MEEVVRRGGDLSDLLDRAPLILVRALNVKFCQILQYAQDRRTLNVCAGAGWRKSADSGDITIEAGIGSFAGFTLISNCATTFESLADERGFRPSLMLTDNHVVSGAGVVIGADSSPFGALCVFSDRPYRFDKQDIAFLRSAANIIMLAVECEGPVRPAESTRFAQPKAGRAISASERFVKRDVKADLLPTEASYCANVSHEIRTPLNIILGYSEIIGEQLAAKGCLELAPHVDAIRRAGQRLLYTVEEIVDFSKIETGSLELNPVDFFVEPMLEELVDDFRSRAKAKGVNLSLDLGSPRARVRFDKYCLERAVTNLLHNAVKFTERGTISVRLTRDAAGGLKLEIRDSGIGIDESYMQHLFEPFSQEDSSYSRRFEGAGLGLALSRKYLELNGATFHVHSIKNVGTTCTIDFRARALADFGFRLHGFPDNDVSMPAIDSRWTPHHISAVRAPSMQSRLTHRG
jgi:histidine kinase/DNA gyrase B/HSP90-like ATPase/phospho-acceptor domain-containing protein/GAF domain-containing protein